MSTIPADLRYTAEHEWVQATDDGVFRVGITDYAQEALGDVVFVQLPEVGTAVSAGDVVGEVESTKSVSDIYAPVSGTIAAGNADLDADPQKVNTDPYGQGWMFDIRVDAAETDGDDDAGDGEVELLDAGAYAKLTE